MSSCGCVNPGLDFNHDLARNSVRRQGPLEWSGMDSISTSKILVQLLVLAKVIRNIFCHPTSDIFPIPIYYYYTFIIIINVYLS